MNDQALEASAALRASALNCQAWPFVEARELSKRFVHNPPEKGYVLFETGYGPSGLPHVGTFGEVVRTTMVRHAFSQISNLPTRLFTFSDDMDALRKVPDNIPNQEMIAQFLGRPLTRIPDPFGTHESFGHHNNARLQAFLDAFGFEYEFKSATDCYQRGIFDRALLTVLQHYDQVTNVILPTLGQERRETYSPFLPISEQSGQVLQTKIVHHDSDAGTIVYLDTDGRKIETPVTGGRCKLQWKADWAMRWYALGVDYEMAGKDLTDSVRLSSQICRIFGGLPPAGFIYELFLDQNGEKISKSRGNGLAVEEWLRYAPSESLALFMYQKPRAAKRLHFGIIPRTVDDYLTLLESYEAQSYEKRLENPVWHIHQGEPPHTEVPLGFGILLNLVSVCHTDDKNVLWHLISRYRPDATPTSAPILDRLLDHAIVYYRDFIEPAQTYRPPTAEERIALADLASVLTSLPVDADAETIQTQVYEVGKRHSYFSSLKAWFQALYETLLGQTEGPRMGSFFALYGLPQSISLIQRAIDGSKTSQA